MSTQSSSLYLQFLCLMREDTEHQFLKQAPQLLSAFSERNWSDLKRTYYGFSREEQVLVDILLAHHEGLKASFDNAKPYQRYSKELVKNPEFLKLPEIIQDQLMLLCDGDEHKLPAWLAKRPKAMKKRTILEVFEQESHMDAMWEVIRFLEWHIAFERKDH